jgi:hypothetical protein
LIRLNRFNKNLDKLVTEVEMPDIITVDNKVCQLEAYAVHIGNTLGLLENEPIPHYIAIIRQNDEWVEINDC